MIKNTLQVQKIMIIWTCKNKNKGKVVQIMAKLKQNINTAISLFKKLKPEERERALGIMQGMLIAKGKTFKEVFPKQKIA